MAPNLIARYYRNAFDHIPHDATGNANPRYRWVDKGQKGKDYRQSGKEAMEKLFDGIDYTRGFGSSDFSTLDKVFRLTAMNPDMNSAGRQLFDNAESQEAIGAFVDMDGNDHYQKKEARMMFSIIDRMDNSAHKADGINDANLQKRMFTLLAEAKLNQSELNELTQIVSKPNTTISEFEAKLKEFAPHINRQNVLDLKSMIEMRAEYLKKNDLIDQNTGVVTSAPAESPKQAYRRFVKSTAGQAIRDSFSINTPKWIVTLDSATQANHLASVMAKQMPQGQQRTMFRAYLRTINTMVRSGDLDLSAGSDINLATIHAKATNNVQEQQATEVSTDYLRTADGRALSKARNGTTVKLSNQASIDDVAEALYKRLSWRDPSTDEPGKLKVEDIQNGYQKALHQVLQLRYPTGTVPAGTSINVADFKSNDFWELTAYNMNAASASPPRQPTQAEQALTEAELRKALTPKDGTVSLDPKTAQLYRKLLAEKVYSGIQLD